MDQLDAVLSEKRKVIYKCRKLFNPYCRIDFVWYILIPIRFEYLKALIASKKADINKTAPDSGLTALIICALHDMPLEYFQILLDAGADANIQDKRGNRIPFPDRAQSFPFKAALHSIMLWNCRDPRK